jgi:predicted HTH domain antitoxin
MERRTGDDGGTIMTISFEIPREIERELSESVADLNADAREAYLVNLYREDRISHHQLAEALGLSRLETEGVLKRHKVSSGVTAEEMRAQAAALREGLGKARPK